MLTGIGLFSKKPAPLTSGPGSLHAALVEIEDGKCVSIEKIRIRDSFSE